MADFRFIIMTRFDIAEIQVGPASVPCVLVFGGQRQAETRGKIRKAAELRWPGTAVIILWDSPDGRALQFDGSLELTPYFSSKTPQMMRSLISGELNI